MSLFRSSSFRIKKRDKSHRPPPLEEMPERPERESLEYPPSANFLQVPDSAHSAFFTLPSAGNSRSSLFRSTSGASSSSQQEDKPRTSSGFFKLSNLSKGSFVSTLRYRGEPPRGRNTFDMFKSGASDDATGDFKEGGYIPYSKRQRPESAEISLSNVFAGLDVIDIAPPVQHQLTPHRQRSRTLSTKSVPDADSPDGRRSLQLRSFTDLPLPAHTPGRSSFDTPSLRRHQSAFLPRLSLDQPVSPLPELKIPPSRLEDSLPSLSSMSSEGTKLGLHSPSPTIVSATSMSTAQDSLIGSYDVASSESDPEQSFLLGEDECLPMDDSHDQATDTTPSKPAPTRPTRRSPLPPSPRSPSQPRLSSSSIAGPSTLSDVSRSPSCDLPEAHFSPEDPSDVFSDQVAPLQTVTSKIKPKVSLGESTPSLARKLSVRAGNAPPAGRLKIRRPSSIIGRAIDLSEDTPPTPSTPSFVVGLAWPRPPLRQVYIDTREPGSSWHSVSTVTDEQLVDESGNVAVEPCHIIMLAHAIDSFTLPPDMGTQEPLSPTAASALAMFALTSRPLVSA